MLRRSLIAGAAIATLTGEITMSDTADAQTKSDPENTLYMDLKQGRVVIQMFPDLAPKAVERVKTLAREGFYDNTPFHRVIEGFMAQGGDPDRHRHAAVPSCRTCRPSSPPSGISCAARSARRGPRIRTARTASSTSCSRRRRIWTGSTRSGAR